MQQKFRGLSETEVRLSREKYGTNGIRKEKSKGFFRCFLENLSDPIIRILLISVALEVLLSLGRVNWFESGGILLSVLIATTVSTASEYGSRRAFDAMEKEAGESFARVMRDGELKVLPISELAVGDIVFLSGGESVGADGILLSGKVTVDQSALNGESREAEKEYTGESDDGNFDLAAKNKVYRGSLLLGGEGVMRVLRVGTETYYGMVARDVQHETRESPLKIRLGHLARQISRLGYLMAALVALTYLFFHFIVEPGYDPTLILAGLRDLPSVFAALLHALTLMITVVVVAVPEGLPMMITVVLSANMKKMLRDGVLVKKPVGIETAGSMNILFTDKTGTITTGRLSLDRVLTVGSSFSGVRQLRACGEIYRKLLLCAGYNTDVVDGVGGNSTERAIHEFFCKEKIPKETPVAREPFSSEKKYSSCRFSDGTVLKKGAPDILLSGVETALLADGSAVMSDLAFIRREYAECTARGERVLAVTEEVPGRSGATFVALLVLKDRLRPGVRAAVADMISAGVQTVMVTGDGLETARAIATECGIFRPGTSQVALSAEKLRAMEDGEVTELLPHIRVIARALPQDKSRLVALSQKMGLVVGMTGDGVNDAPSLKRADIGFAMGSGTDIAKGTADIVLLDNGFRSICNAVLYGRTIFQSIRKFIVFQLMMNFAACGISLVGQFIGIECPITIVQMLWINMIMDTFGGLAFAGEAPSEYVMKDRPKKREEPILTGGMIHKILFTGGYTLLLSVLFLKMPLFVSAFRPEGGDAVLLSAFYALFVFMGIFNCFGARSERLSLFYHLGKNKLFVIMMSMISVVQVLMIYFGGTLFRTVPLTPREFLLVILLSASVLVFEFFRRIFCKLGNRC